MKFLLYYKEEKSEHRFQCDQQKEKAVKMIAINPNISKMILNKQTK